MKRNIIFVCLVQSFFFLPLKAKADLYGGDLIYLAQILDNSLRQLEALKRITGAGEESIALIRDLNRGVREVVEVRDTLNRTLRPGAFSDLESLAHTIDEVKRLYGKIPQGADQDLLRMTDQSVAESIHLHNEAFRYADSVDREAQRIKEFAEVASPQAATKGALKAQGVSVHVLNQILRTNAAALKLQSEGLALANRKEKLRALQFQHQYRSLQSAFGDLKPSYDLPRLRY